MLILLLSSCGGGTSTDGGAPDLETGVFLDSPTSGLSYNSPSSSGITNTFGEFHYKPNETLTFSIGGITLGSAPGNSIITPLDLARENGDIDSSKLINILRLLQTLDVDLNPENGIQISSSTRQAADGVIINLNQTIDQFPLDENLLPFLTQVTDQPLAEIDASLAHFRETIVQEPQLSNSAILELPIIEIETNNSIDTAHSIVTGQTVTGELNSLNDSVDYFEITPEKKGEYVIELSEFGANIVSLQILWSPTGNETRNSDDFIIHEIDDLVRSKQSIRLVMLQTSYYIKVVAEETGAENSAYILNIHEYVGSNTNGDKPNPFEFNDVMNAPLGVPITSNEITIGGLTSPAEISISNGEYSIGCRSAFTSNEGRIHNGQTVCVRHVSASTVSTTSITTLRINGHPSIFSSTTVAIPQLDMALARKNGCTACHSIETQILGPAWLDVALRYRDIPSARLQLIEKVKTGGMGNWNDVTGGVPMPPYSPRVADEDITKLVDGILWLDVTNHSLIDTQPDFF